MRTAVFIVGTNGVGKTTVAKKVIELCGGVVSYENNLTRTKKGLYLAGKYDGVKNGGVDGIYSGDKLFEITKVLKDNDVFLGEGSRIKSNSFMSTIFLAERKYIIFLYAPALVIQERLSERSNNNITKKVLLNQIECKRKIKDWKSWGIRVHSFDTSKTEIEMIAKFIYNLIYE